MIPDPDFDRKLDGWTDARERRATGHALRPWERTSECDDYEPDADTDPGVEDDE